jgi:hypothetical protein
LNTYNGAYTRRLIAGRRCHRSLSAALLLYSPLAAIAIAYRRHSIAIASVAIA